jgi:hypothetical protein
MKIIHYADRKDAEDERLARIIGLFTGQETILTCRSLGSLRTKLRRPCTHDDVLLICPSNRKGLAEIVAQRELLSHMKIVLVLPDRDEATVALGHLLRPRMISYNDSDFLDVAAVLVRMREKSNGKSP